MLGFLRALFTVFQQVAQYFNQKQTLDAGRAEERADNVSKELKDITAAADAKNVQRTRDTGVATASELPDDGFKRD